MQLDESDAPLHVAGFYVPCAKNYYVSRRIRDTNIPKLNAVGLLEIFCRGKGWREVVLESTERHTYWIYQVEHDGVLNISTRKGIFIPSVYWFISASECYGQVIEKARELDNQLLSGKEYVIQNRYVSEVIPL